MVASTALVAVLITFTTSSDEIETYILSFAESNAIPTGLVPAAMVASTALVAVLITETSWPFHSVTYILLFAESNAMCWGKLPAPPTDMVVIIVLSSVSITVMMPWL